MNLFSQMRERRLFQIIVSYAVAGWGVLEVIDQLVDRGIVPNVTYRVALIWYLGAFVATVLIGWYHGEKGRQKPPAVEIMALLGLAAGVLVMSGSTVRRFMSDNLVTQARASELDLKRVAVLYFTDQSPDHAYQFLADGLTESLIDELGQVNSLSVVSRNGVAQFRNGNVAPDSAARVLQVGTVVDGSVEHVGSSVRVNVRLLDAASGAEFRRAAFERPASDLLAVRAEVTDAVARLLREWLGEEVQLRDASEGTRDVKAWALLQRAEKARKDGNAALHRHDMPAWSTAYDRADLYLAQAMARDTAWAEPAALAGELDYQRARVARADLRQGVALITQGLAHAERALALRPRYARALELRGTLRYWRWLIHADPDPVTQKTLLAQARKDLEAAVQIEPGRASAYSVLSHLYANDAPETGSTDVVLAAQKAYEEDAYLEVANDVLFRLFTASIDLEQFTQAQRWCDEGVRRFPQDDRFAYCRIMLMTTPSGEPNPAEAWRLLARIDSLAPAQRRAHYLVRSQILIGAVLARANLPDSARAVLHRAEAQITPQVDPAQELLPYESFAWEVVGDRTRSLELLKEWVSAAPGRAFKRGERIGWMWRPLQDDPRFRQLEG